jgi:conjugal transfer pilin signal peptidase TrbI
MNATCIDSARARDFESTLLGFLLLGVMLGWVINANYVIGWWNESESLAAHVFIARKGEMPYRGDYVAFRWRGGFYPAGSTFLKIVGGIPGDTIERQGQDFYINAKYMGKAKSISKTGAPLVAADPGVLGPGEYYVMTPHPDSLDSRYKIVGAISQDEIIGKAYVLF